GTSKAPLSRSKEEERDFLRLESRFVDLPLLHFEFGQIFPGDESEIDVLGIPDQGIEIGRAVLDQRRDILQDEGAPFVSLGPLFRNQRRLFWADESSGLFPCLLIVVIAERANGRHEREEGVMLLKPQPVIEVGID